jgi:hypothetical protein
MTHLPLPRIEPAPGSGSGAGTAARCAQSRCRHRAVFRVFWQIVRSGNPIVASRLACDYHGRDFARRYGIAMPPAESEPT